MNIRISIILVFLAPLIPASALFPLHGAVEIPPKPALTWANVASGKFQEGFEKDFARHFGWYAPLVKLDNTVNYAFRETNLNANHCVIIGKDETMLAPDEVEMHDHGEYSWPEIEPKIQELAQAAEKLKGLGVRLVTVVVPAKLNYYPGKIPERWKVHAEEPRPFAATFERAVARMKELGISVIDAREALTEVHTATGQLGYSKRGRHWNQLVSCEVLGKLFGFSCLEGSALGEASDDEQDQFRCLNAFFPFTGRERLYRPGPSHAPKANKAPKGLFVGSSFTRELEFEALRLELFADLHDFYYNKTDYGVNDESHPVTIDAKWKEFILSRDLIVVDFFETQMDSIGHGFATQVLHDL